MRVYVWISCKNVTYLEQLVFPRVLEGGVLLNVAFEGVLGVENVDAKVTQGGPEEVLFGRVLEQGALEGGSGHLLVDGDGLLVVGQLGCILGHLQNALVGRRVGFLAPEVVAGLLVVSHRRLQVRRLRLVNFSNRLKLNQNCLLYFQNL